MRFFIKVLSWLALFGAVRKGPSGISKYYVRRKAHQQIRKWLK